MLKRDYHLSPSHQRTGLQEHIVLKIDAVIDVDFIYDAVEKFYSEDTGGLSVNPVLLIKIALFHVQKNYICRFQDTDAYESLFLSDPCERSRSWRTLHSFSLTPSISKLVRRLTQQYKN